MKTYFDVGANNGWWGEMMISDPDCRVYFFEPTPEMVKILKDKFSNHPRAVIVDKAVSDIPGTAKFNVAGQGDWGCSSLLDFKDPNEIASKWPGRPDIKKSAEIQVECIRMDDYCKQNNITRVDIFHCDVQGMDLRVLQSFGDLIHIVQSGQIETATSTSSAIYANQDATLDKCREWLESKGFIITQVESNDPQTNEVNIHFCRKEW
jgi:FkbM family methyltransferase